jgi:hypothetical protein
MSALGNNPHPPVGNAYRFRADPHAILSRPPTERTPAGKALLQPPIPSRILLIPIYEVTNQPHVSLSDQLAIG